MPSAKHLEEANAALTQWLSPEHCGHLVSAVISKYIALTPEELDEWQVQLCALEQWLNCCLVAHLHASMLLGLLKGCKHGRLDIRLWASTWACKESWH